MAQPYQFHDTSVLNRKMKSVENYGRIYITTHLDKDRERQSYIRSNSRAALIFFYGRVFYRGRKDKLSAWFMKLATEVLQEYEPSYDIDLASLEEKLHLHGVNNHNDRIMVKESIRFIRDNLKDYDHNIFNWAVDAIRTNRFPETYHEITSIHAIGDKLSTFYLRDVALVSDLEPTIQPENYIYFQPIDTWVRQGIDAIGIPDTKDLQILAVKEKIITCCLDAGVSPLLFNAGAWMMGAKASQLTIELL